MIKTSQVFFLFTATLIFLSCSKNDKNIEATQKNKDIKEVAPINASCPERLEPVEYKGKIITIGDGTYESCTQERLFEALSEVSTTEWTTLLFNCGQEHIFELTETMYINGLLIIDGEKKITFSGANKVRVIELHHYSELVIQRLKIKNGRTEESGAGVLHPWYGTLHAIDVIFENNHCTSKEGEIGGGAIFAGGLSEVVISGCKFINNSASNGGGILNRGSTLTIVDSVFNSNEATSWAERGQYGNGGGLYIDGMNYDEDGDFNMCGTVFENNNAKQHGSAVFSYFYEGSASYINQCQFMKNNFENSPSGGSGGLYHETGLLRLTNSTLAENTSLKHAAGLFIGSGSKVEAINNTFANNRVPEVGAAVFNGASEATFTNCTFAGNDADYGPAIFKGEKADVSLKNCIFYNNTTSNQYSALACHETLKDEGGNIQWPKVKQSGNEDMPCAEGVLFADSLLLPLGDYGGPTLSMMPEKQSPAIDYAFECPEIDQRGEPRLQSCDSGAIENTETQ